MHVLALSHILCFLTPFCHPLNHFFFNQSPLPTLRSFSLVELLRSALPRRSRQDSCPRRQHCSSEPIHFSLFQWAFFSWLFKTSSLPSLPAHVNLRGCYRRNEHMRRLSVCAVFPNLTQLKQVLVCKESKERKWLLFGSRNVEAAWLVSESPLCPGLIVVWIRTLNCSWIITREAGFFCFGQRNRNAWN